MVPVFAVLAWVGHSLNWIRERHHFLANAFMVYSEKNVKKLGVGQYILEDQDPPFPLWLLGERGIAEFHFFPPNRVREIDEAKRLFPEARVDLMGFPRQP